MVQIDHECRISYPGQIKDSVAHINLCLLALCCLRAFLVLTISPHNSQGNPGWFSRWVASICLVISVFPTDLLSQWTQCHILSSVLNIIASIWASSNANRSEKLHHEYQCILFFHELSLLIVTFLLLESIVVNNS